MLSRLEQHNKIYTFDPTHHSTIASRLAPGHPAPEKRARFRAWSATSSDTTSRSSFTIPSSCGPKPSFIASSSTRALSALDSPS